ncbi:MAG: XTP/dITP diphosphatase [Chloroflexi bacterium]|nr:XTP/dITP diphosphatase [Chloroflexota bacterium]
MPNLLIATNNQGKLREFRQLLHGLPFTPVSPREIGLQVHVEEDGGSFAENALLKASAFAHASGLLALADDSGLEVDALGGEPGILSARYGGPGLSDADRCRLLLQKLRETPDGERQARFRCVIAVASPQGRRWTAEGACAGVIAHEPQGSGGFGYDPLFFLPTHGCTMAELPEEEKNRISHRAAAARGIRPVLQQLPEGTP